MSLPKMTERQLELAELAGRVTDELGSCFGYDQKTFNVVLTLIAALQHGVDDSYGLSETGADLLAAIRECVSK